MINLKKSIRVKAFGPLVVKVKFPLNRRKKQNKTNKAKATNGDRNQREK